LTGGFSLADLLAHISTGDGTMRRTDFKHATLALCLAIGLAAAGTTPVAAQTTLRLAHASSEDSLIDQAVRHFSADLDTSLGGKLKVQDFPNGQLGDEGPIAEGVGSGSIDIGLGGVVDAIDPKLNVVALPFLFRDLANVHAFLDSPTGRTLATMGADRGYHMLGFLDSGFRNFANSRRPIVVPADLRGLKIRTPPIPVILDTIKALGALPQAIPFGQVYTSLQSHVVDGVEPEMRDFWDQKWYEAAKYLTVSNYIWTANFWFMNKGRYDALPPDQRAVIDQAATETVTWYRAQLDGVYAKVLSDLKAKGVIVNQPDIAPFRAVVGPIYTHYESVWGADFVDSVRKAAEASAR
jgi:tripartite ATP-independent transporter DctP family solute receptor